MSNRDNDENIFKAVDSFNEFENNFFYACLAQVTEKHDLTIKFSSQKIKELVDFNSHIPMKQFVKKITQAFTKFEKITEEVAGTDKDGRPIREVHSLFRKGRVYEDNLEVAIQVDKPFLELFNDLDQWTRFSLVQYTRVRSKYSKKLFRLLKQYRVTGTREFSIEDFRKQLSIPKSYDVDKINSNILTRFKEELSPFFRDFKITKMYRKGVKGRKIAGYVFSWRPESRNEHDIVNNKVLEETIAIYNIRTNSNLKTKEKFRAIDRFRGLKLGTTEKLYKEAHPRTYFLDDHKPDKRYMFISGHLEMASHYSANQLKNLIDIYELYNRQGVLKEADLTDLVNLEDLLMKKKLDEKAKNKNKADKIANSFADNDDDNITSRIINVEVHEEQQ